MKLCRVLFSWKIICPLFYKFVVSTKLTVCDVYFVVRRSNFLPFKIKIVGFCLCCISHVLSVGEKIPQLSVYGAPFLERIHFEFVFFTVRIPFMHIEHI